MIFFRLPTNFSSGFAFWGMIDSWLMRPRGFIGDGDRFQRDKAGFTAKELAVALQVKSVGLPSLSASAHSIAWMKKRFLQRRLPICDGFKQNIPVIFHVILPFQTCIRMSAAAHPRRRVQGIAIVTWSILVQIATFCNMRYQTGCTIASSCRSLPLCPVPESRDVQRLFICSCEIRLRLMDNF